MITPTHVAPTPVARAPLDITLPNSIQLPTSLIGSLLSQIPTELGTYNLPSSVPGITLHYSDQTSPTPSPSSSTDPSTSSLATSSSSPSTPSPTSDPGRSHSPSTAVLAGIFTVVALLLLALIVALIWFLRRRKRRQTLDRDMAEAAVVPRGTVSRSRIWRIRGGDRASDRTRSLLSREESLASASVDMAGVGTYALARRSSEVLSPYERPAIKSPLSPTYTEIMSPAPALTTATEPVSSSAEYERYVPPVHHDGYFPPVFDVPDARYAALAARDPFADALTPTTEAPSSSEDAGGAPYAHRAGHGPQGDPDYVFPHAPLAYPELAAASAGTVGMRSHRGSIGSSYESSGSMVFAPVAGAPHAKRVSSHTGYGDWLSGGPPVPGGAAAAIAVAAPSPGSGSGSGESYYSGGSSDLSSSQLAAQSAMGHGVFSGGSPNASRSGGALETIPERGLAPPPPLIPRAPSGPETPAELSDESDYTTARRLTVANQ